MNDITPGAASAPSDDLHAELRALIASRRQRLASAVNAELTHLNWSAGKRLHTEVLGGAVRAKYGDHLINRVGVNWRTSLAVNSKPKICPVCCSLLRQYIPKKLRIDTVTEKELAMIKNRLNHRLRKRLGFKTPHEVFHASQDRVALRP